MLMLCGPIRYTPLVLGRIKGMQLINHVGQSNAPIREETPAKCKLRIPKSTAAPI
jgi:hypothetical protein